MKTVSLALKSIGDEGQPLPAVFRGLHQLGAEIRRGQVTLIAAASGGGKSTLATYLSLSMNYGNGSKVPTLYFSADSDRMTFGKRVAASVLRSYSAEAERLITERNQEFLNKLDEETRHMWVSFDEAPTPVDIDTEVNSFALVYGQFPHLIVVDNLMDVSIGDTTKTGHDLVVDFCRRLARRTQSAVIVLCHVTGIDRDGGYYSDGKVPIPKSGLMNKIDKSARLILTLFQPQPGVMEVCVVKNTGGRADSQCSVSVRVPYLPERGWFG